MKLTQMRYFAEVCQWGSITKAAERLFVSQPAVTSSIKTLEKEIGMPLLYRSKKESYLQLMGKSSYEDAVPFSHLSTA